MTQKRFSLPLVLLVLVALIAVAAPLAADSVSVKKDITVAPDEVQDNLISLGGNVVVDGRIKQTVIVFGGTLTISGEVGESVIGIGTHLVLKPTAVVKGDLVCIGGTLDKQPGSRVAKDTVNLRADEISGRFFKGISGFPAFLPFLLIIKVIGAFLWLLVALVIAALFPKQIAKASDSIHKSFWSVFATGLLAIIVFSGLVIFSVILCFVLIGIPVLIALVWAGIIIKLFGRVILFFFFGESLLRAFGAKKITAIGASLLGLLFVTLMGLIPFFGVLLGFVMNIIGWGAVLRTKFGTVDHWIGRKHS